MPRSSTVTESLSGQPGLRLAGNLIFPGEADGLLEGRAFAIRKQHRLHVERSGKIGRLRPEGLVDIGILQGFIVAMQIEHEIGAKRHMQQLPLQPVR